MGAHTFYISIGGVKMDPAAAYQAAVDEALYEHGADAYNGTISTTSGFRLVTVGEFPLQDTIDDILDHDKHGIEKWGRAGVIELKGTALKDWKRLNGLAGKRNVRAYILFGWASS